MAHMSRKRQKTDHAPCAQTASSAASGNAVVLSIAALQQVVQDDNDTPTTTSLVDLSKNLGAQAPHKPKRFEDLPGEIRNAIYRATSELVPGSSRKWREWPEHNLFIEEYTSSRPFAMLRANRQIQNEFYNILFPVNHQVNSDNKLGMVWIHSELGIGAETAPLQTTSFDLQVAARYFHERADRIEILFTIFLPEGVDFTKESYDLIDETISESFDNEDDFSVLNFLVALDRVWSLKIELDVENWQEPNLSDLEGPELEDVLNNDEEQTEYVFRLVMEPDGPNGSMMISMDTERIDPYC